MKFGLRMLGGLMLAATLSGCGGGRPPVAGPAEGAPQRAATADPVPVPSDSLPLPSQAGLFEEAPRVRILIQEDFESVLIEGSTLATALRAESRQGRISIFEKGKEGEDSRPLGIRSGWKLEPPPERLIHVQGRPLRGTIEIFINPLGVPVVVNEVEIEDYLRGVVPNELGPRRFPRIEALKAQSVAARTYILYHLGSRAVRGFDAYADQRSQVYAGAGSEDPLSDQAVQETRGLILVYQQQPILALYSSTCGGETGDFQLIFGGREIPYLRGGVECSDTSSPFHSWEDRVPISRIRTSLNALGIGRLKKVETLERQPSGRITQVRLTGEEGQQVLSGNRLRFALDLRSSLLLELNPVQDGQGFVHEIRVKGRGWGHGVGLCQIGAVELAGQGFGFQEILETYYQGAAVVRAYP